MTAHWYILKGATPTQRLAPSAVTESVSSLTPASLSHLLGSWALLIGLLSPVCGWRSSSARAQSVEEMSLLVVTTGLNGH